MSPREPLGPPRRTGEPLSGIDPLDLPEPLAIELQPHRETIVVAARGEIDTANAAQLEQQLAELVTAGFTRVVLDLRGVTFMDSTGLHAVLEAQAASRRSEIEFALVQGPAPVARLFELTGVGGSLTFIDPAAIDRGSSPPG
jgi:anti-sigma B factor antagonist